MFPEAATSGGSDAEEAPQKKTKLSPELPIPSLPDDIFFNCLVRVSRLYHPTLSLVSKGLRSVVTSPELYETRSLIGCTEHVLYVCFRVPPDRSPTWYTLCSTPRRGNPPKSSSNLLIPLPSFHYLPLMGSAFVAVGSEIYVIGGSINNADTSSVWVLDCRFHSCRQVPSMTVARTYPAAGLVDGKIYVLGGCESRSTNWAEVFDLKTQTWELATSPDVRVREELMCKSEVMKGKIYIMGESRSLVYEPKEDRWDAARPSLDSGWTTLGSCVIDNILYCYHYMFKLIWYDSKDRVWTEVKGLENLPNVRNGGLVAMANCGGKVAVIWDSYVGAGARRVKKIWCAEIKLESRNVREIWGTVEWCDVVLTASNEHVFLHCLAVSV